MLGFAGKVKLDKKQSTTISSWIGSSNFVYNGKCDEDRYYRTFARKYHPIGVYAPIDSSYSQFKTEEAIWLKDCPSEILRNSITHWRKAYSKFFKEKSAGRPKRKKYGRGGSITLDKKCFEFKDGDLYLFPKSRKFNLGKIKIRKSKRYHSIDLSLVKTVIIRKRSSGEFYVSFCYEDFLEDQATEEQYLSYLKKASEIELEKKIIAVDQGIAQIAALNSGEFLSWKDIEKKKLAQHERRKRHYQKMMSRRKKGSNRYKKAKLNQAKHSQKIANIRNDRLHKISHSLTTRDESVIIFEDLKIKNMTKKPKAKKCEKTEKWLKNSARAKAGLNKSMLNSGLGKLKTYTYYKAERAGKVLFLVDPKNSSRRCSCCGFTSEHNRKSQADFKCDSCGFTINSDHNAAVNLKHKAVNLLTNPGTGLRGAKSMPKRLEIPVLDNCRKARSCKTRKPNKQTSKDRKLSKEKAGIS